MKIWGQRLSTDFELRGETQKKKNNLWRSKQM